MPLAFDSLSHGSIAFGFFNIESDMLLCDRYFIFADRFCRYVVDIAQNSSEQEYHQRWKVWRIKTAEVIGDLMGAIHGVRYTGFIGDLYRRFPFPPLPQDFKQNPLGFKTQSQVIDTISKYADSLEVPAMLIEGGIEIQIGDYRFDRTQFQDLIRYIWRGGYPRWKDEKRPAYVDAMSKSLLQKPCSLFEGLIL